MLRVQYSGVSREIRCAWGVLISEFTTLLRWQKKRRCASFERKRHTLERYGSVTNPTSPLFYELLNPTLIQTMPRPRKQTVTLISSAQVCAITGYTASQLKTWSDDGVIKRHSIGRWPMIETLAAICKKLRVKAESLGLEDRARKNKAEADTAELDALTAANKTCFIAEAKQFWSDARIEVRQVIERAAYLTPIQKTKLLGEMAELKTKLEIEK